MNVGECVEASTAAEGFSGITILRLSMLPYCDDSVSRDFLLTVFDWVPQAWPEQYQGGNVGSMPT